MCYPWFFYQPWPFVISLIGLMLGLAGFLISFLARRAVTRMAALLREQEARHRDEITRLLSGR